MKNATLESIAVAILLVVVGYSPTIIERTISLLKDLNTAEILSIAFLILLVVIGKCPMAIAIPYSIIKDFLGLK